MKMKVLCSIVTAFCAGVAFAAADGLPGRLPKGLVSGVYRELPLAAGKEYTFRPRELSLVLEGGVRFRFGMGTSITSTTAVSATIRPASDCRWTVRAAPC